MKAEEKFNARLKDLGLWERWCEIGMVGRIGASTEDNVIILVNESDDDNYTEFVYPPMEEMAKSEMFRSMALAEFVDAGDEKFIRQLIRWWIDPKNKCPLYPEDAYFLWSDYTWTNYEDDPVEVMDATNNHSLLLVKKINKAYSEKPLDFLKIVRFLAERDNEQTILAKCDTYMACHDYCQYVADDADLATIIAYCMVDDDEDEESNKTEYQTCEETEEYCPHCDECVSLAGEFKVQKCPNCGKWIVPCSLCPMQDCTNRCPLERMAIMLNREDISK